jgi:L-aspartate oxidase
MGLERNERGLAGALATLEGRRAGADADARDALLLARLSITAARHRAESRGAHYRSDLPEPRPEWARRIAWLGGQPYAVPVTHHHVGDPQLAKEAA